MAKTADGIEAKRVLMSEVDEVFVKKGDTFKLSQVTYEVTNTKKDTVAVCAADKKAKSVTIPSTVKIEGDTYKVTSIKANAFKKCKKLKKINIKSANITSMNKKAFTGLDKGTAIKIKKSKFKKYSKMIKNRDVKVKKL